MATKRAEMAKASVRSRDENGKSKNRKGEGATADIFRKRGLRCTPQRLAVLSALKEHPKHLSITGIHERVKNMLPGTGLATVYRSLEALLDLGLIARVYLENASSSYTLATMGHGHQAVCMDCNRVMELSECPLDDISRELSSKTGFSIESHFLQFFGRCGECQNVNSAK